MGAKMASLNEACAASTLARNNRLCDDISESVSATADLAQRIADLADRLVGPVTTAGAESAKMPSEGTIGEASARLRHLRNLTATMHTNLSRIEERL